MPDTLIARVLIVGAGPAGYTAAIYAARAGLRPLLVAGLQPGGQLMITTDVENFPGFAEAGAGSLADGADGRPRPSTSARGSSTTSHGGRFRRARRSAARATRAIPISPTPVIIATGAQARWLGLESERRLQGFGVSACATCDGFFFRGKRVAVVGGGNTAVEEALYLTHHAEAVTLIHRRDRLRAGTDPATPAVRRAEGEAWCGTPWWRKCLPPASPPASPGSGCATCRAAPKAGWTWTGCSWQSDTLPNTAIFRGQMQLDDEGYVVTAPGSTRTSVPGVFAAGDVQDKVWRQAVTAAGTGCMAALEAEKWLAEQGADSALAAD